MKIIFVRHGEPLRNDYGIADMGKQEMRFLAEYLKQNYHIDNIISATSQRAKESVDTISFLFPKITLYRLPDLSYPLFDKISSKPFHTDCASVDISDSEKMGSSNTFL